MGLAVTQDSRDPMDPRNSRQPGSAGDDGAQRIQGQELDRPRSSSSPLPSWVTERARDSVESSLNQKGAAYQGAGYDRCRGGILGVVSAG